MRLRNTSVLLAAVLAAGMDVPAHAFAVTQPGFSVRPAHVDPADPATRAYFKPVVVAGRSFADQVVVANISDAPIDLIVSAVDGLTGATSGAVYANRQPSATKAGAWVTPDVGTLSVAAHRETAVGFTVRVPLDATPGDHLAGIAFEVAHAQSTPGRFAVTQVIREVVGVEIVIPGPAEFLPHVDAVELRPLPGVGSASVVIHLGDGGRKLGKPGLSVSLDGPDRYHRRVEHQLDTILPGDTIPFPLPWPDTLRPGNYTVTVVATGGPAPVVFEAHLHLGATLRGADTPQREPQRTSGPTPWLLLLISALGGVVLGVLIVRRPRRRARHDQPRAEQSMPLANPPPRARTRTRAARHIKQRVETPMRGGQNFDTTNKSPSRSGD
jgi:hypothetical protein